MRELRAELKDDLQRIYERRRCKGKYSDFKKEKDIMRERGEIPVQESPKFKDFSYLAKHKSEINRFYREGRMSKPELERKNQELQRESSRIMERR